MEPDGGNLYREHLYFVPEKKKFWTCAHGLTGVIWDGLWGGCRECAQEIDPEVWAKLHPSWQEFREGERP